MGAEAVKMSGASTVEDNRKFLLDSLKEEQGGKKGWLRAFRPPDTKTLDRAIHRAGVVVRAHEHFYVYDITTWTLTF